MDTIPLEVLFITLTFMLLLSAFFSSSETSMLSLNRYRLRHLINNKHKGAMRAGNLLERPDRLIGVILIGNNLVNIIASIIAGEIGRQLYGDFGMWIAAIVLALVLLVASEVTPKTIAAAYPEKIAFPATLLLKPLLRLLYPLVFIVNWLSNGLARALGIEPNKAGNDHLHPDELRTVVNEAGDLIPDQHQGMLLNVLDLEKSTVEDIMIPRNEITGIDLERDMESILDLIRTTDFTRLPVYEGDINNVVGVLHMRKASRFLRGADHEITQRDIREHMSAPYFVPESTPLHIQLMNFQKEKRRLAIVVDEYGEVQGAATLVDLLEEIVGEFSTDGTDNAGQEITAQDDGWFLLDATASIRDINKQLGWELSTSGPKTINGLAMEYLENIPDDLCSFDLNTYRFELVRIGETMIESLRVKKRA
ncbi:MAG: HlyC/CorC family transporter [Marinagarivorans sp.]|nr:HlyC/CorC family transporter [Marinagarivorans sp.]